MEVAIFCFYRFNKEKFQNEKTKNQLLLWRKVLACFRRYFSYTRDVVQHQKKTNMFDKIFGKKEVKKPKNKNVHCEISGEETDISNTVGLIKINGLIIAKNFRNAQIDHNEKMLYSDGKPPQKFHSELIIADELKRVFGSLYTVVDDEDDIEKSTAIMSIKGAELFSAQCLAPFIQHFESDHQGIRIPDTMFISVIDSKLVLKDKECDNWQIDYKSAGNKYRFKKILKEEKQQHKFGMPNILFPGFDVGVGDCSDKNPNGTGYQFKTENSFQKTNLCSNESAVDFCENNKAIIFYNDFLNKGQLRALTTYTPSINKNLQNGYLYRSSNI